MNDPSFAFEPCAICGAPDSVVWEDAFCPACRRIADEWRPDLVEGRANLLLDEDDRERLLSIAAWLRCVEGHPVLREPGA